MCVENLTPTWFRTQNCQPLASRKDDETGEIPRRLKGHFSLTGPEESRAGPGLTEDCKN